MSCHRSAMGSWQNRLELLVLADPPLTPDEVAAVAPTSSEQHRAPVDLILAVLTHPHAPPRVVGRYATSHDPAVLRALVQHPLSSGPALDALAHGSDRSVALTACRRLIDGDDLALRRVASERLRDLA